MIDFLLAQAAPAVPSSIAGDFSQLINPLFAAAGSLSAAFVTTGKGLFAIALTLEILGMAFQYLAKGGVSDLIGKSMRLVFLAAIPFALLCTGKWDVYVQDLIAFFETFLVDQMQGVSGGGLHAALHAFANVFNQLVGLITAPTVHATHWWDVMKELPAIMDALFDYLMLFIPIIIFGLAMAFALFGPLMMLYIGAIFGPLLVPFLVFKPLSNLAQKWFSYMITMGIAFVVGIVLATIMAKGLEGFADLVARSPNIVTARAELAIGLIPMIVAVLFMAYMMLKTEHIASALIGGPAVGAGAAFIAYMGGKAAGGAGKAARAAMSGGASVPVDAAASAAKGAADLSKGAGNVSNSGVNLQSPGGGGPPSAVAFSLADRGS